MVGLRCAALLVAPALALLVLVRFRFSLVCVPSFVFPFSAVPSFVLPEVPSPVPCFKPQGSIPPPPPSPLYA